ncbi:hypothetical protein ABXN37_13870 [Piscinibacter sakaiensis]|nr:hypothetical protein [Piscinibacter sakaiensis]
MSVDDARFQTVPLNTGAQNPCSPPAPALPWLGLVIQAPATVGFRPGRPVDERFTAIPVCGFYRVELSKVIGGPGLVLVASDPASGQVYRGPMLDVDAGSPRPNPHAKPLQPEDAAGILTDAYFNPNLARYVALPAAEAVYDVHAEYAGLRSNTVRIRVMRR